MRRTRRRWPWVLVAVMCLLGAITALADRSGGCGAGAFDSCGAEPALGWHGAVVVAVALLGAAAACLRRAVVRR